MTWLAGHLPWIDTGLELANLAAIGVVFVLQRRILRTLRAVGHPAPTRPPAPPPRS